MIVSQRQGNLYSITGLISWYWSKMCVLETWRRLSANELSRRHNIFLNCELRPED